MKSTVPARLAEHFSVEAVPEPLQETCPSAAFAMGRTDAADRLFVMQRAFRATGGLTTGDALAVLLRDRCEQPLSLLARWIVGRQVVSFEARGETWLPMFQFEPRDLTLRQGPQQVIAELRSVFDDWELTEWFANPNSWLGGLSPANCIANDAAAVVQAARADRFVAAG